MTESYETRRNELSGTVGGSALQAGTINGDVHFHSGDPRRPIPRQLIAPTATFAGRAAHLDTLDRLHAEAACRLVVLSGPGGVGKTTLATTWAHRVVDHFVDGQLYFDLSAFGPAGPADPAEALTAFLHALGVSPGNVPTALAEQSALYRSMTSTRSLLVMLDDAYSAAQVRALLPASPTSLVLVTSRRRVSGLLPDGARLVDVGPLSADDAVELLTNIVGSQRVAEESAAAAVLVDVCGGLPLALSVAGARLASRPTLSVGRVVAQLAEESGRLDALAVPDGASVQATFDLSYHALDRLTGEAYRRLAFHPGRDFGPDLVIALASDGAVVERLLEANLLQEIGEDRFRFHVLVRLHARRQAVAEDRPEDLTAARLAMLEWYFATAVAADIVLTPYRRRLAYPFGSSPPQVLSFTGRPEALAWLERERVNLVDATTMASDLGHPELSWHLAYALWPLFLYRKHYRDRLEVDRVGVAAARAWGNAWAEAVMLKRLGRVCANTGDIDAAVRHTRTAIQVYDSVGDRQGHTDALEGLAGILRDSGDDAAAAASYVEVLASRRTLDDPRAIALTLINLGSMLTGQDEAHQAVSLLQEARAVLGALPQSDPYNEARAGIALADACLGADRLHDAERMATDCATQMRELGSPFELAESLDVLGRVAERRSEFGLARQHFDQAAQIFSALGSRRAEQLLGQLAHLPAAT